jgi:Ca2+/Na+ antiporter
MVGDALGATKIALRDVLHCDADDETTFVLQYIDRNPTSRDMSAAIAQDVGIGKLVATLELRVASSAEQELCMAALTRKPASGIGLESVDGHGVQETDVSIAEHHQELLCPSSRKSCRQQVLSVGSWLCFPVLLVLELTVPKCFTPSTRKRWPLTFMVSMAWLAFFSYWICVMADKVHDQFGISESFLGLTLTAIGTSFPNCVASVIVARKGQCSMAVANALGSNIQNVFLALGLPWLVHAHNRGGEFQQPTKGMISGTVSMGLSLLLFIVFLVCGRCQLGKWAAWVFLIGYLMFFLTTVVTAYMW